MNKNVESHFSKLPKIGISRSRFDRSSSVKFSFNTGELIPFLVEEVLPGDTFKISTSKVVRLQTLITPMMDNVYLDTMYFFVPNRLLWDHWRECMGENTSSPWIPDVSYSVPQVSAPSGGWQIGTIADYMGIPTGVDGFSVSALPFRAYSLIWNEWFRDENLQDFTMFNSGDAKISGSNGSDFITDPIGGGKPLKACKYHDYFTSCLPSPQKGADVEIPVGTMADIPVYPSDKDVPLPNPFGKQVDMFGWYNKNSWGRPNLGHVNSIDGVATVSTDTNLTSPQGTYQVATTNLFAHPSDSLLAATSINQLRLAFATQELLEKDARGGTRYTELLRSHFGIVSPDSRLQRPEYLGGNRMPLHVNQVIQQSQSTDSPLGSTGAMSLTSDVSSDFTQSFTEHGLVIGLCTVRYDHTYQQGIDKMWMRKTRFDYYWPAFANIGEQPVYQYEIYANGGNVDNKAVFGYNEAWSEYRYKPSRVAGEMRSDAPTSLDVWHLADDYAEAPHLSAEWIQEDKANVDRVLAVQSSKANQVFADFYIKNLAVRPMPVYSIPKMTAHF